MIWVILIVLLLAFLIIRVINTRKSQYDYTCYLLTLHESKHRRNKFIKYHEPSIPLEIVYGINTKNVKAAIEFEDMIEPEYYEKAIEMHYDKSVKRPDITFFNLGAIGALVGHVNIMKNSTDKYALIMEDNVIVKTPTFYKQVQQVIDKLGDNFEMCFFHCLSRIPVETDGTHEKVIWISSMKCYLVHVKNMKKYLKYYFPMDNHIDNKTEDIIAQGARVYYKDLRQYIKIDRSGPSTIGHSDHGKKQFFSRQYPHKTPGDLKYGY